MAGNIVRIKDAILAKKEGTIVSVLLAVGFFLRFFGLSSQSLWFDEISSIVFVRASSLKELIGLLSKDFHPPLYFFLLRLWVSFVGETEIAVRMLSAFVSCLLLIELYVLAGKLLNGRGRLLLLLLAGLSPFQLYFAQEARPYVLVELLSVLSMHAFLLLLEMPLDRRHLLFYVSSTTLLLYSHYIGALIPAAQLAMLLYMRVRGDAKGDEKCLFALLLAQGAVVMIFLPWLPVFCRQLSAVSAGGIWIPKASLADLAVLFRDFSSFVPFPISGIGSLLLFTGALLLSLLIACQGRSVKVRDNEIKKCPELLCFILFWLLFPVTLAFLLSHFDILKVFQPKTLIISAPAMLFLLAFLLERIPGSFLCGLAFSLVLFSSVSQLNQFYLKAQKEQWRELGSFVRKSEKKPDCVYFLSPWTRMAFDYYYKEPYREIGESEIGSCSNPLLVRAESQMRLGALVSKARQEGYCEDWKKHFHGVDAVTLFVCKGE